MGPNVVVVVLENGTYCACSSCGRIGPAVLVVVVGEWGLMCL